ncbi:class I SAM-dependent methyltransferase [Parahaliea mediterranea]|uniref:class I SAM-dependent methyltransferase n=1 Tax=Parahaliea mediterranea TaxID=651086 RepID=UPI0019D45CB7|nr:methyltransferase domain-containing protein [Parahaliea mediterranea]
MVKKNQIPSDFDIQALSLLRANIHDFLKNSGSQFKKSITARVLDIAPQIHSGARPFFPENVEIETLDIDPASGATHIADICDRNLPGRIGFFDGIVCTEVLEHTLQPFDACDNLFDLLKSRGRVFVSTPYNFRIHGPLPDCWRFTEYGLRQLFRKFEIEELKSLETEGRSLMPIQYTLVARKP